MRAGTIVSGLEKLVRVSANPTKQAKPTTHQMYWEDYLHHFWSRLSSLHSRYMVVFTKYLP